MRLGMGEILVVLALAMLFFGPSKLPALGASLGEAIRGFKRGLVSEDPEPEKPALEAGSGRRSHSSAWPSPSKAGEQDAADAVHTSPPVNESRSG